WVLRRSPDGKGTFSMDSGETATVKDAEVGLYDEDTEPKFREPLSTEHRLVIVGLAVVAFLGAAIPIAVSARDLDQGWFHPFRQPATVVAAPAVAGSAAAVEPPVAAAETLEAVAAPDDSMAEVELAADEESVADEELAAVVAAEDEA